VVGGGNTAVEEALYLSNLAEQVTLIHRRSKLRAEKTLQQRLFDKVKNGNINIIWDHQVNDILGDDHGVTGIQIQHFGNHDPQVLPVHGVFIAIGHTPNTSIFQDQLDMKDGYIQTTSGLSGGVTATNIPGVFAAGDVCDHIYRQAITSAGFGCMAALDAEKYLDGLLKSH